MIKFTAQAGEGTLYGFGLTEANLNRLEFNKESIFFDFGYAGHPDLFGLILYFPEFKDPTEMASRIDDVSIRCAPFLNFRRGVTVESLRVFPIAQSIMQKFREVPFWGFDTSIEIAQPGDMQLFFAGRSEQDIEEYFQRAGFISPQTRRTHKGFGRQS